MYTSEEIHERMIAHHYLVRDREEMKDQVALMTVLVGSQNYMLDDDESDIDTVTFVLPNMNALAEAKNLVSFEFETTDGKCIVKDIRKVFNLLVKTSPNSIELVTSRFKVYSRAYMDILEKIFAEESVYHMIHANYESMLTACAGLAHQLNKRNMPSGKRYSHALRIRDMLETFLKQDGQIIAFRENKTRLEALLAKRSDGDFSKEIEKISTEIWEMKDSFELTAEEYTNEVHSLLCIRKAQKDILKKHLDLNRG